MLSLPPKASIYKELQAIVRAMHACRQFFFDLLMAAQLVADVDEVSLSRLQLFNELYRFSKVEMRYMFFASEGIDHQDITVPDFFLLSFRNKVGIRDIRKSADAKSWIVCRFIFGMPG